MIVTTRAHCPMDRGHFRATQQDETPLNWKLLNSRGYTLPPQALRHLQSEDPLMHPVDIFEVW